MRWTAVFCGAGVLTLAALFSAGLSAAAAPHELRFCLNGDPKTFDALHVSDDNSELVRFLTGGVLLRINRVTDQLQPELAESWKLSEGGRAITFHLRSGLKFSDGSPLNAEDVARTLKTALDPKQASPAGDTFRSTGNTEVRVDSPLDVTIRYSQPKPGIDRLFDTLSIVPEKAGKLPASAGPFFVSEYRPGDYVQLTRNPHYWKHDAAGKPMPYLDSIRLDIQPNREIEVTRFLRGETHLVNKLTPEAFDRIVREKPAAARSLGASLDSEFLWFNQSPSPAVPEWKRKWFTSVAFRRAVSASIHRDDIARVVFRSHAHPAAGVISPANRFWFNASLKELPFDPQSALRGLAAEGFVLKDGTLRDRDGHAVEFSLITNSGNRAREATATVIQDDLRKIGIQVNIVTIDFSSLIERIAKTSQYEACLLGFVNVAIDPMEQMNIWLSSGEQHPWWPLQKKPATTWEAQIDQLELRQASEPSRTLRKKAVDELQRIVAEQEPIVYLVNPDYLTAISPSLRGVQPVTAPPQILWNIEYLTLE
ncbi:MAG TPA: ABC transporter substrate-binding protein [Bryobacteraceae bacterium]|nr:ABC transporter substrate-binding protein [Bryobacteraceae bacterium]